MLPELTTEEYLILFARRREILNQTYAGAKPEKDVWEVLAEDMREAGFENMANNLMQRWEKM